MHIKQIDPSKYDRLFTFGCSFTNYFWPTWADILGREFKHYENWGKQGAGNQYIFNSIIECDTRNNFTDRDLILVMWSSVEREDRYSEGEWLSAATHNMKEIYGLDWSTRFQFDVRSFLVRDLATITAVQQLLELRNVDWANYTWTPLSKLNRKLVTANDNLEEVHMRYVDLHTKLINDEPIDSLAHSPDVINLYKKTFTKIEESVLKVVYKGIWPNGGRPHGNDNHPTPKEHWQYLQYEYPDLRVSDETLEYIEQWDKKVWQSTKRQDFGYLVRENIQRI